jgi:small ubiquitin-related modifier
MAELENGSPAGAPEPPVNSEHLNIKVSDNNNEVFFKIKRTTKLEKLMSAFCERQGKSLNSVRFLFEGTRVQPTDTPEAVSSPHSCSLSESAYAFSHPKPLCHPPAPIIESRCDSKKKAELMQPFQLEMQDGDQLDVHQEQVGGS